MLAAAYIAHQLPRRVRIRVEEHRGDKTYFQHLNQKLGSLPGIHALEVNPLTGSVLIFHSADFEDLKKAAERHKLFHIYERNGTRQPLSNILYTHLETADHALLALSRGRLDLRSVLFLILFILGFQQLLQGNVTVPAVSLFWYALATLPVAMPHAAPAGSDPR